MLDSWRLAIGTLTAIPVRPPSTVDRRRAAAAMVLAPIAVLPLGLVAAVVALAGLGLDLPPLVTALLAIGALVVGNRAFHLDGLSDTVDGLAASYDPTRSLEVMKSGTSGPAGVAAVVLVLGLQTAALTSLVSMSWRGAVVAGVAVCLSRAALAACCMRGVPSARQDGLGSTYTETIPVFVCRLMWIVVGVSLAFLAVWIGLPWWRGAVAALLALAVVIVLIARANRRFGGVTGDVFGASIELSLAVMLVALS